jgi:6-phosphofructokinase
MLKKVAILANGGDVSGFNAVIRGIVKTAEKHRYSMFWNFRWV